MKKNALNKDKKSFFSRFAVVFTVLVFVIFISGIIREAWRIRSFNNEIDELQQELENLKMDRQEFLSSIDLYESELFVEQEARTKFNLQKPGEEVVVIPVDDQDIVGALGDKTKPQNTEPKNLRERMSKNLNDWWAYFF